MVTTGGSNEVSDKWVGTAAYEKIDGESGSKTLTYSYPAALPWGGYCTIDTAASTPSECGCSAVTDTETAANWG
jgi:hypothetical protein